MARGGVAGKENERASLALFSEIPVYTMREPVHPGEMT